MKIDWLVVGLFCKNKVIDIVKFIGLCISIGLCTGVIIFFVIWTADCPYIIPLFIFYYLDFLIILFLIILTVCVVITCISDWIEDNIMKAKKEGYIIRELNHNKS